MNWIIRDDKMGPRIDPRPKAPVWIDATDDCKRCLSSGESSYPLTFVYSSSSVWNIAGTLLLLTKAPPMPPRPTPIHKMTNLLKQRMIRLRQMKERDTTLIELHLLCHEGSWAWHQHTNAEEKKTCELDQSILHSISLFFDEVESHWREWVSDGVDGKD